MTQDSTSTEPKTDPTKLLAQQLLDGQINEQHFLREVAKRTIATTDQANVDLDRARRAGYPEVVYAEGKSIEALIEIIGQLRQANQSVLATRVNEAQANAVLAEYTDLQYNATARTLRSVESDNSISDSTSETMAQVAVVSAGTSDLPVAEEAAETLRWMQCNVDFVRDVGVAGPHRLPAHLDRLQKADCVVVVAGMEGALPSVVAGYLSVPIIAVPTSVGYGANFGGVAALLSMLNSCAANVAVVNIDAGFKGGYLAGMIAQSIARSANRQPNR